MITGASKSIVFRMGVCVLALLMLGAAFFPILKENTSAFAAEAEGEKEVELSVDPSGNGDGYSAVLYDNTGGLPTSEANAIVMTQEGFIWIGSYSGLIRYDGNTFQRIDSTSGIASVVSLYADSKNRLWVGTNDSGLALMDNGNVRTYNKNDGLSSLSVRSIAEDKDGNIFIATTQGMAYINSDLELVPLDEPQINQEYIRMIKRGPNDVIYGLTMGGAVFTIEDRKVTAFYDSRYLGISEIRAILPDPERPGYIYLGDKGSELYYGELSKGFRNAEVFDLAPLSYINSIFSVGDMIWICTDHGIGMIRDGKFITIDNVPMSTSVEDMMTDYQGNLWFVSSQQGVMKIVPDQFTDIFDKYNLQSEVVYSTCIGDNKLFIGTKTGGLIALQNGGTVDRIPITSSVTASGTVCEDTDLIELFADSKIRSIIRDSRGRLWFSTFGSQGLVRYDHGKVTKFTTADGMPSERVRAVSECADGRILVACTGGLAIIKDDKITDVLNEASGISNTEVLTAVEAPNGDILVGTDGGGIYVVNSNGVVHLGTESGLNSDVVMRIKRDVSRDICWIVTSNSISYITTDNTIETIKKFPYSNNFDLYENSKGEIWILSSNGIYVTDADELIENGDISPLYYGRDNGLPCITTSNSYSELTEDGDLYISCTTGVCKVNIEDHYEKVSDIKLAVPFIEADGEYIYPEEDGSFRISSKVSRLTIYSFVYNYSLTNPNVTYRLEGFEKNSTTVKRSELAAIDYTNLKGGEYSFQMKIQDPHGLDTKQISVKIVKEKAVWETLWFKITVTLVGLLLIGMAVTYYIHIRMRRFRQKEQEQKTLIREIVEAFAKVIDMKDKYTNGHSSRVAEYTSMLTRELGYDEETIERYYNIALMHDIGKIGVPPEVLNKPGKLTDQEFAVIKSHSALGYNALKDISILPELATGAGAHHERPDGKGYPKGLKGDEIPRVAQIIAVADTFDAMYSDRPYRKRMNFEKVVSIMKEVRGTQLTEDVVDAFLRLVEKGEFRDPNDDGGGSTEDIDNIHKRLNKETK